jgi:transcriptional regulator with XRE-family HTH domain
VKKASKPKKIKSGKANDRVRELRKFLGWSQEKLAIASDCKREYIGKIERKITDPQVSNLEVSYYRNITSNQSIFTLKTQKT